MATLWALTAALLVAPAAARAEVAIENRAPEPFVYHVLRSESNSWSPAQSIAPGQSLAIPAGGPIVIGYYQGQDWVTYQLAPGKLFRWARTGAGAARLFEAAPAPAAPPAVAAFRPAPVLREIRVFCYADESYRRRFPEWRERTGAIVSRASRHFENAFGLRFTVVECRPWGYDAGLDAAEHVSKRLIAVSPWSADLVIAFVGAVQPFNARIHQTGWYAPFGQHVAVADVRPEQKYGAEQLLVRLLSQVFGAFPVVDRRSIMNGKMENIETPRIEFGPVAEEIIRSTLGFDFRRGPTSLAPETAVRIRELYRQHHHPERNPENDPISEGLKYRAARNVRPLQLEI